MRKLRLWLKPIIELQPKPKLVKMPGLLLPLRPKHEMLKLRLRSPLLPKPKLVKVLRLLLPLRPKHVRTQNYRPTSPFPAS